MPSKKNAYSYRYHIILFYLFLTGLASLQGRKCPFTAKNAKAARAFGLCRFGVKRKEEYG